MPPVFKRSLPAESDLLSEIAIQAKEHWGYSQAQLDKWRPGLRIEVDYIERNRVRSFWLDERVIGFFAVTRESPHVLDHLWILPQFIGKGYGKQALESIRELCNRNGIEELIILSDPDAEGFYRHHGATRIGEVFSPPQNRMLPKLSLRLH